VQQSAGWLHLDWKRPAGGGMGIHWDEIDEDISAPGLLMGNRDITNYKNFI
jgi:hypothetical protein